jgi:Flp pilus assembly CpaE family ATPase
MTNPLRCQVDFLDSWNDFVISLIHESVVSFYRSIMALIVGIVSQKGGVGKSTLARLVAREYALAGWSVKIADLDVSQGTSFNWQIPPSAIRH